MTFVSADAFGPDYFDDCSHEAELWSLSELRIEKRVDEALLLRRDGGSRVARALSLLGSELHRQGFPLEVESVVLRDLVGAPVLLVLPPKGGSQR
jgi:hypothetical protein